jgi:hypothetical protein
MCHGLYKKYATLGYVMTQIMHDISILLKQNTGLEI